MFHISEQHVSYVRKSYLLTFITIFVTTNLWTVHSKQHPAALPWSSQLEKSTGFQADWNALGQEALKRALEVQQLNTNVAKNVILFLGDGMGISTVTAGRIYAGQLRGEVGESSELSFDKFPHVALSKTYNVDYQVPDSAGTATAFLCGEKTNLGLIGVNQNVLRANCSSMSEENNIQSILRWSLDQGKRAGVVTTTRITHATPASSYAHSPDRDWEADTHVPVNDRNNPLCEDIASQLITKNSDINIILGGGRRNFLPNTVPDYEYPQRNGLRTDGRNLIEEWKTQMTDHGRSHAFVWNKTAFEETDFRFTDYVFGLFDESHMKYGLERSQDAAGEPTIAEMAAFAINSLSRSEKGYFLLVEGGRIDHAHHDNWAKSSLTELAEFNDAIQTAVDLTDEQDTLIVVTADHSHVFTMGGYPVRNNSIIDFVDDIGIQHSPPRDSMPFVTVMYANGPSGIYGRQNLTGQDATADSFRQPSHVPLGSETHGGEDVAIFARGPMAHLFHGLQEQSYIAHAMAYASCVGGNLGHCNNPAVNNFTTADNPDVNNFTTAAYTSNPEVNASSRSYYNIKFLFILLTHIYLI